MFSDSCLAHCCFFLDPDVLIHIGRDQDPIHFAGFMCSGSESRLLDCPIDRVGNQINNCRHIEDVGVRCRNGENV